MMTKLGGPLVSLCGVLGEEVQAFILKRISTNKKVCSFVIVVVLGYIVVFRRKDKLKDESFNLV